MIHTNTVIHASLLERNTLEKGKPNHVRLNILITEDEIIIKDKNNNPLLNLCLEQIHETFRPSHTDLIIAFADSDAYEYISFNERMID